MGRSGPCEATDRDRAPRLFGSVFSAPSALRRRTSGSARRRRARASSPGRRSAAAMGKKTKGVNNRQSGGIDFIRAKKKVGKKIKKHANVTDTTVRAKRINLPGQTVGTEGKGEPLTHRGLSISELLNQTSHYSEKVRKDALEGMRELLEAHPETMKGSAAAVVEKTAERLVDREQIVRIAARGALKHGVLPALGKRGVAPFAKRLVLHVGAALTHVDPVTRRDAPAALETLLDAAPELVAAHAPAATLRHLADLLRRGDDAASSALDASASATAAAAAASARRRHRDLEVVVVITRPRVAPPRAPAFYAAAAAAARRLLESIPRPRAGWAAEDVRDAQLLRVAEFVELEQHGRAPVRDEVGVFGEDDVDAAAFAASHRRERRDLRVGFVRRDDELEPLAFERGDELVRHRGGHVHALREEKRGAFAIPRREALVAFPERLRASIPPLLLLAAFRGETVAVEHDHRGDPEVPEHLRAVDAVPDVRRVPFRARPPPVPGAELERAAVRALVKPRVRVDRGSLARVLAHAHGGEPRPQDIGQPLDPHRAARSPWGDGADRSARRLRDSGS